MRKLLLSLLIAICSYANAQTFTEGSYTYTVTGDNTVEITTGDKTSAILDVPSTVTHEGVVYDVTSIGAEAFQWNKATTVTIPGSIKTIGEKAFYYGNITSITFNEGLEEIGTYAFGSSKCVSLVFPNSLKRIADHAFFGSSYGPTLTSVTFGDGLEYIGSAAFYGNALTELDIPASVDTIASTAFLHSNKLEKLTFHDGLKYIGAGAFNNTDKRNQTLTSVTLPSTLSYLGDEAFLKMPITSINVPAALETFGESAIAGTAVEEITIDPANKNFHLVDGILYSTNNSLLYAVPMKGKQEVSVVNGCIGIVGGAFWGSEVSRVTLPNGLLAIGYGAFQESELSEITFPTTVTYVDELAFAGTKITDVTFPENAIYIYEGTFAQCPNLKTITLSSGLQAIDVRAFYGSNNIESVTCKGSKAPGLVVAYEYEEIFTCPTSAKLYVPKGAKASYQYRDGSWDSWDTYFTITETEQGTLVPVELINDSTELSKYAYASFQVRFGEEISLVNDAPEAYIRANAPYNAPYAKFDGGWKAMIEANNTLTVFAMDADGYMDYFVAQEGDTYYVTIPEGVVKNAAGEQNEHITMVFYGPNTLGVENVSAIGKADGKVVARYNINGQQLNSAQKGINIVRMSDGSAKKIVVK
ncbi:MAG: leucine-rich repeat domain-containing protein [Prevotella sp.]|nr:leucine-rich repeat domain-containing protein [Prevotella sp.]